METIYQKPKQNVRFYFVTLKWHKSTCYVNWAILIGDLVDVTTLLLNTLYLKIAHLFLISGPVSPSRQQFSQNYSCIKPEDTILWHCMIMYLSVILMNMICHSYDSDNNYSTTAYGEGQSSASAR